MPLTPKDNNNHNNTISTRRCSSRQIHKSGGNESLLPIHERIQRRQNGGIARSSSTTAYSTVLPLPLVLITKVPLSPNRRLPSFADSKYPTNLGTFLHPESGSLSHCSSGNASPMSISNQKQEHHKDFNFGEVNDQTNLANGKRRLFQKNTIRVRNFEFF